jgi:apolipoprotein N-acyltransferase
MKIMKSLSGCALSAVLLIMSFPKIEWWPLAWVALVPLLFALDGVSRKRSAFGWGLLFGFIFFFGTLGWLTHVTYPGAIILALYLAIYPALFAAGTVYFKDLPLIPRVFILAALWTVLEFLRAILFTGFGWVTLGHSQYKNLLLIQIADIIGLYGISFLVILVNLTVFETIKEIASPIKQARNDTRSLALLLGLVTIILLMSLMYGLWTFQHTPLSSTVKVAVVQPNIPQKIKWDERYMQSIVQQTIRLTEQAARTHPDLIVWPETSLPGILSQQPAYLEQIQLKAMDLKTPIMMGAITDNKELYYNSAILIGRDGKIQGQYNKMHLVPFGEFLPLRPVLGWLNKYIGLEDFTSGHEYTLFPIGVPSHRFGVLICFEDALNDIWRGFTLAGGDLFMNITNDAWFMDTKEPYLHMQGAVFQCVLNKRSLVRSANTGVSGFIDPLGRILGEAKDPQGKKTFVEAVASADVPINKTITFYTKYADVFTYLCFVCILGGVWLRKLTRSPRQEGKTYV